MVRNLKNPPVRDVAMGLTNGYLVLRVFFENPGFMAAHCHIEPHSVAGMFVVFMVGTEKQILEHPLTNHKFDPIANNKCG